MISPNHDADAKRKAFQQKSQPSSTQLEGEAREPKQAKTKHDKSKDDEPPVKSMNERDKGTMSDAAPKKEVKDTPKDEREFTSSDENQARYMFKLHLVFEWT